MGVIDSLGQGFHIVLKRWWILLIPVLLDSFLWLGPQASVAQIVREGMQSLEQESLPFTGEEEWQTFSALVIEAAENYNLFYLLRAGDLGMPSLFAWSRTRVGSSPIYEALWMYFVQAIGRPDLLPVVVDAHSAIWQVRSVWLWGGVSIVLSLGGLAIGSLYLTLMADELYAGERRGIWGRALRLGGRFLLFWFLRAVVAVVAGVPIVTVIGLMNLLSPALAMLAIIIVFMTMVWLSFLGVFMVAAMAVNDAPLWEAIWNSVNVVIRNVGSTAWLFVLINLIGGGMAILWQRFSMDTGLAAIAIMGNACIGSGLVVASLAFYSDRYIRWQKSLRQVTSGQRHQLT